MDTIVATNNFSHDQKGEANNISQKELLDEEVTRKNRGGKALIHITPTETPNTHTNTTMLQVNLGYTRREDHKYALS